jgi:hypothetical protein
MRIGTWNEIASIRVIQAQLKQCINRLSKDPQDGAMFLYVSKRNLGSFLLTSGLANDDQLPPLE